MVRGNTVLFIAYPQMKRHLRGLPSTSILASNITSIAPVTNDTLFDSLKRLEIYDLLQDATSEPSHHQPTTTAHLLSY